MSLLDLIFNLGGSRDSGEGFDDEEAPPSSARLRYDAPPTACQCNNCGRVFNIIWTNHYCPARCGGRLFPK